MIRSFLFCLILFASLSAAAQPCVEVSKTPEGKKMLVGFITRAMIFQDTAFREFAENGKWFTPQAADVDALKAKVDSVHFIVIFGTWCHDSQNLIPQFYKWIDAAEFPERRITIIAVDKQKKAQGNFSQAFGIKSTPTFIVMRNGLEAGRVIEYGKSGNMVAELAELVRK